MSDALRREEGAEYRSIGYESGFSSPSARARCRPDDDVTISTVGHGTMPQDAFVTLLRHAGLTEVVDIRSFPGSRRNPQFGTEQMARWLPDAGVDYSWQRELGGRRKVVPVRSTSRSATARSGPTPTTCRPNRSWQALTTSLTGAAVGS